MKNNKTRSVAILSGEIPSTTFIEHLILGVSKTYTVKLFGTVSKSTTYEANVEIYETPTNRFKNLCLTVYRGLSLLIRRPKDYKLLVKEIQRFSSRFERWTWFSKFVPIVLYRPDILHLQWARDLEFYAFFKTTFNIPLVLSLRGAHINYTPIVEPKIASLYKKTFPLVDTFHAVSNAIAGEATKYGNIENRTVHIPSPLPNAFFTKYKPRPTRTNGLINIVSVGRFHWVKGFRYAIDAISILKTRGYEVRYTIIGASQKSEAILFQLHQLQLQSEVHIKGKLPQDDVLKYLQTQDVLLLPSIKEGLANVVLEAMAIGLPVISTDCGGMAEVIIHKETGWLVPVRDAEAIANAVVDFVNTDNESLNQLTKKAHHRVSEQHDYDTIIAAFINLYDTICT
ncbi:glycosyltransferase family 4 protein [Winogradskyella maritima]|uniref:Glycosyltransferase family 4 protein n=1 Tax=Winogradskyella maritima TaxID=1517766 RepID=A0ABV8AGU7_9FLAO|nr:glycosyltransferase family 4 protein [Winogradskyella maritima]